MAAAGRKRTATAVGNLDSRQTAGPASASAAASAKRPRITQGYPTHLVLQALPSLSGAAAALPTLPFDVYGQPLDAPSQSTSLMLAFPPVPGPPVMMAPVNQSALLPPTPSFDAQPSGLAQSQQRLHALTHAAREEMVQARQETTKTGAAYGRHIKNYTMYWSTAQDAYCAQDPSWTRVPAFPITATTASLFVKFEMQRPKLVKSKKNAPPGATAEYQEGTTVGVESIKQAINALEAYRKDHAWQYPPKHETQGKLRDDLRIRTLEEDAAKNESQRVDKAQKLKAAGTSADTYTVSDLIRLSRNGLCEATTPCQLVVDVRDRAMLLVSTQMAFRGDNLRHIQLSDMSTAAKVNVKAGPDCHFQVMVILADQGKTNKESRVDEFGALRHKRPELCAIGALAMHLFVSMHPDLGKQPIPSFSPDFSPASQEEGFGEYGKREWYSLYLFRPDGKSTTEPMKYSNHYKRIKKMHAAADVSISKATHAGRANAAQTAREHGASVNDTKALGLWNESGSYRKCYDRLLPIGAMLGAAHHVADRPEDFFVARDALEPPPELLAHIFPWVEGEEAALRARQKADTACKDFALEQFFDLLKWLRRVLVQDLAVLYSMQPSWNSQIFQVKPFNLPIFDTFARGAAGRIADAERTARLHLDQLPERIADGFRSTIQEVGIQQRAEHATIHQVMSALQQQISSLATAIVDLKQLEPRAPSQPQAAPTSSSQLSSYAAMLSVYQGQLTSMNLHDTGFDGADLGNSTSLAAPTPHLLPELAHWPNTRIDSMVPLSQAQPVLQPAPLAIAAAPAASFGNLPLPVNTSVTPPGLHSTPIRAPSRASSLAAAPAQQALTGAASAAVARTPSTLSPLPPSTSTTLPLFPAMPSAPQLSSQQPQVPPVFPVVHHILPMPIVAPNQGDSAALFVSWQGICMRYSAQISQVEAHRAAGEWRPSRDGRTWVPVYKFSSNTGLFDLWKEWTEGCDGKFSVDTLDTGWSASWRAEAKIRTAYCRRARVIALLRKLIDQQRAWNIQLAIRFLDSKGPGYQKHTTLYNTLMDSGTESKLMMEARSHKF